MPGPFVSHARFIARTFLLLLVAMFGCVVVNAQSNSGSVTGAVVDPTGAAVPGAKIVITNPVSGYTQATTSDVTGRYTLPNLPFHSYVLIATMPGFSAARVELAVDSSVPKMQKLTLAIATSTETVTVDAPVDLVENDSAMHTDIDRSLIDKMPIESATNGLSSIVAQASPGVAADSNGLMHGLGDHAENSFSIDGQPITDQQSKVFSNQVPAAAVQSLEVIAGAPPAEYGDKTSLVVKVTTRSGQGVTTPTGTIAASYGTFGSSNIAADVAFGGKRWGNFLAVNGLQTGRFLDAPEFNIFHDKGNEENFFDRVDYQFSPKDTVHLNMQYTRSWFQNPNDYENLGVTDQFGTPVGDADQKSKIGTVDIAPSWTHIINADMVFNAGAYLRRDTYHYYPSSNPLADFAPDQQQESVGQFRTLTNVGTHDDLSYVHGIHNAKIGVMYEQTFVRENDAIGLVDPSIATPDLAPYDLTAGGTYYNWHGQTDVKQLALYAEDQMTMGSWLISYGIRGDFYNGLTIQREAEPRAGVSYTIKKTGTVLRASYARTQETPFNENLVLSSTGCADPVLFAIFATLSDGSCSSHAVTPFNPGFRNEFHAGLQQALGRHFVVNAEYIWKYTHNAYDFSVLGTTPITFPIEWHNSKIPGVALSATLTDVKGLSVRFNASSVAARFFNPQLGGVGATPVSTNAGISSGFAPFRIDHDERFNQSTNLEYKMPFRKSMYYSLNWHFDSGLVAGATPCYNPNGANTDCDSTTATVVDGQPGINLSGLSADQQFQAGLACNGVKATPTQQIMTDGISQCTVAGLTSSLLKLPAINAEDADHNPSRVNQRNLFDMALGDDDVLHFGNGQRYKFGARLTAINVTNKYALYNFLSTFSGTHYVTPRTVTAEISLHF
jgi:hypothetical protein